MDFVPECLVFIILNRIHKVVMDFCSSKVFPIVTIHKWNIQLFYSFPETTHFTNLYIGGVGNFGQSEKVGQLRTSGKIRHGLISRNIFHFKQNAGINNICIDLHYLLNMMFFVPIYQFSGKVLVNRPSPKLPLLT